jgi:hypothetical protein
VPKLKLYLKRIILGVPIAAIIGASFFPLPTWCRQALVFFVLLWFNVFILFEVLGQ